ncbi:MAG: CPXCG motif-containing cysteine-rich protein [Bacteroidota bacterium]
MNEHFFDCPYCGAEISMLLDPSVPRQEYIEDCEVCCNPINIHFEMEHGELISFDADSIEQ